MPDAGERDIERYKLPNILALNSNVVGLLGEGAASSMRADS